MPIRVEVYGWLSMEFYLVLCYHITPMQDKVFPFNLVRTYVWLFLKPFSLPPPFLNTTFFLITPFSKLRP
jgi:hypothetical protein